MSVQRKIVKKRTSLMLNWPPKTVDYIGLKIVRGKHSSLSKRMRKKSFIGLALGRQTNGSDTNRSIKMQLC
jgi:hypothetical protein